MNIFEINNGYRIGEVVYRRKGAGFGPRRQADLQLVYVHEGDIRVFVDGESYDLQAGEATLLLPGHDEFFRFALRGPTRHGWCTVLRPELPPDAVSRLAERPQVLPLTSAMQCLLDLAAPLANANRPDLRQYRDSLIRALFLEFISRTGCGEQEPVPLHPAVERAQACMETRYAEALDVAVIAGEAGVTPTHLIRLCRSQLGDTPRRLLWRIRCRRAAGLLEETGLSAAEIAYRTGFASPQHFSRVFSDCMGSSPGRFRRRKWNRQAGA